MQLTPFGKLVRNYRTDLEVRLKEMAEYLDVTAAYLSAVETGKKRITDALLHGTEEFFGAKGLQKPGFRDELRNAAALSKDAVDMGSLDGESRMLMTAFARKLPGMSEEEKNELWEMLKKGADK